MGKKENKGLEEMISGILSNDRPRPYEGFKIIEDVVDNKMSKDDLIAAIDVIKELIFTSDKETRDKKYLFSKGLLEFNKAFHENKNNPDFVMTPEQENEVKEKIKNIKPLLDFVLKIEDVLKETK